MRVSVLAMGIFAMVALVPALGVDAARSQGGIERVAGTDRYATSTLISQRAYPSGSDVVYLASGVDGSPDALSASSLSDGPLLLIPPCGTVPSTVLQEHDRLAPEETVVLGGPAAVADQVVEQIARREADDLLACPGAFASQVDDVALRAEVRNGTIFVTMHNGSTRTVSTDTDVLLEQRNGPAFDIVGPRTESGTGLTIPPGETRTVDEVDVSGRSAGQYRVRQTFFFDDPSESRTVAVVLELPR